MKTLIVVFQLSMLTFQFSLVSCTKADIDHLTDETAEGSVQIYPVAMPEHPLPVLAYYFYSVDNPAAPICRESDENGNFEGKLPVGTYRVIATNTQAANVAFSGMDRSETAVVSATGNGQGRSEAPFSHLSQPGLVYSVVLSELPVAGSGTVRRTPGPVLLTKELTLSFTLQGDLNSAVSHLSGVLPGVFPFVHLYTCTASAESVQQAPGMAVPFNTVVNGAERQAHISLFGLRNPEYGQGYTNTLTLTLTLTDGSVTVVTLDLTEVLSDIFSLNAGLFPEELTVHIDLKRVDDTIEAIITGIEIMDDDIIDWGPEDIIEIEE